MSMSFAENFYANNVDRVFESVETGPGECNGKDFDREMERLKDEKLNELWEENKKLQGSELSKQCKAKDKWINKLLMEIEKLEGELL